MPSPEVIEAFLTTRPKKVALIGLGLSHAAYVTDICLTNCARYYDEVWTVNFGIAAWPYDKAFCMDDNRKDLEVAPPYGEALKRAARPYFTSTVYPEFPQAIAYPVAEIIKSVGDDYFNTSVAYAIGYALATKVDELTLYGCDFWYPNLSVREEGAMCAAYLLGLGRAFGMKYRLPHQTTLLSAHTGVPITAPDGTIQSVHRPLYGYVEQPFIPAPAPTDATPAPPAAPSPYPVAPVPSAAADGQPASVAAPPVEVVR